MTDIKGDTNLISFLEKKIVFSQNDRRGPASVASYDEPPLAGVCWAAVGCFSLVVDQAPYPGAGTKELGHGGTLTMARGFACGELSSLILRSLRAWQVLNPGSLTQQSVMTVCFDQYLCVMLQLHRSQC